MLTYSFVVTADRSTIGRGDAFLDNLRYYLIAQDRSPKDVVDLLGRNQLEVVSNATFVTAH